MDDRCFFFVVDVGNEFENVGIVSVIMSVLCRYCVCNLRKSIKKTENCFSVMGMAGVLGFEPRKCQIQSLMPYRLAIPQYAYL